MKITRPTYSLLSLLSVFMVFAIVQAGHAQNTEIKLDGYVQNEEGQSLTGATVWISPPSQGTAANEEGYFSLLIAPGQYTITFSFIGYVSDTLVLNLTASQTIVRKLKSSTTLIDEVIVTESSADKQILQTETGHIHIKKEELENMPFLLGEIDPVRMIQLMPGIHTAGEGSTGFYVRGGAVDQNMMFLDNTVIYNPSHLFGFFSIFNGSTINSIDLYKSGMPANYGGRLSSFTDIQTRSGNAEGLHGEGSLGIIAANVLVEGPIKKNKSSFLVAARRTYVDLFLEPLRDMRIIKQDVNYYFYDLNVNADFQLGRHDHLRFRSYLGQDNFEYSSKVDFENLMRWKNAAASLSWLHQFNSNLYSELIVGSSLYDMSFGATISTYNFDIKSDILDYNGTYQLNLEAGKHNFTAGIAYTQHALQPNNISAASEDVALNITPSIKLHADESAFYINDKIKFSDRWEVNAGIRLVVYRQLGPFSRYIQDENFQVLDTVQYNS
ncbi:MAG TPA: TonB-dependent receptor, partial [Cyclobacteriaceae bacterium]